jgi:hypothetical protein
MTPRAPLVRFGPEGLRHLPPQKTSPEAGSGQGLGCCAERIRLPSIESRERSYDVDGIGKAEVPSSLKFFAAPG